MNGGDVQLLIGLTYTGLIGLVFLIIFWNNKGKGGEMSTNVLDGMAEYSDEDAKEDFVEESNNGGEKRTPEQLNNQRRIRGQIKEFVRDTLENLPEGFHTLEVKKIWGNKYRVNVVTVDQHGNKRRPFSYFLHYQPDQITVDKNSQPLTKLPAAEELTNATA